MVDISSKTLLKKETFKIKVLSPIHVGTGRKVSIYEYLYDKGFIEVLSFSKLISQMMPEEINKFHLLEKLEGGKYLDLLNLKGDMGDRFDGAVLYRLKPIDRIAANQEIWEHIKTVYNGSYKAMIPGSEIKGFIRTAVIYKILKEKGNRFLNDIRNNLKSRIRYNFLKKVEYNILGDPKNSIFKLLRIADVYFEGDLSLRKIYVANTTRYKRPEYYETIEERNISLPFDISIYLGYSSIEDKYIDYLEDWKKCCYEFSNDLIDRELSFWNDKNTAINTPIAYERDNDIKFGRKEVINQLEELRTFNKPETPLLRIGKLTGYFSHSIGMLLTQDHNLKEFGKALSRRAKDFLFPLTRRLTLDNQTLGWCQLVPPDNSDENKSDSNTKEENKPTNTAEMFKKLGWRVKK